MEHDWVEPVPNGFSHTQDNSRNDSELPELVCNGLGSLVTDNGARLVVG